MKYILPFDKQEIITTLYIVYFFLDKQTLH